MSGIKPKIDLMLSAKILRPSTGRWSILEAGKTWEDFDNCSATAVRRVRVGWRLRRGWVTAGLSTVDGLAAIVAYGLDGASKKHTYLHFTFYAIDPHMVGSWAASANLGGGLSIPVPLSTAHKRVMERLRRREAEASDAQPMSE